MKLKQSSVNIVLNDEELSFNIKRRIEDVKR